MYHLTLQPKLGTVSLILCILCSLMIFAGLPFFGAVGWLPARLWKYGGMAAPLALGAATVLAALFLSRLMSKRELSLLLPLFTWNFLAVSLGLFLMAGHTRRALALLPLDALVLVVGYFALLKRAQRLPDTSSDR